MCLVLLSVAVVSAADQRLRLLEPADHDCPQSTDRTLVHRTDGTWSLALVGSTVSRTVKVLIP